MSAYQLGQLAGGVIGFVVVMLIFTSPKRLPDGAKRRRTRVAIGGVGLGLGVLWIVNVASQDRERLLSDFKRGCVVGCVKQGATADRCAAYCDCELASLAKDRTREQTVAWMGSHINHGRPDAEFVRVLTDTAKACTQSSVGRVTEPVAK